MNEETSKSDIDRVGLSETSRLILEELVADGHFKDAISGYRMAISFSIFKEVEFKEHAVNRPAGHMYLISQLDPEGIFGLLIEEMYPEFEKLVLRSGDDQIINILKEFPKESLSRIEKIFGQIKNR